MSKKFDIVMYTNAAGLGTDCIGHAHRLPFIKGIARAMKGIGKVLVVLHYRSAPRCWFNNTPSGGHRLRQIAENLWTIRPLVFGCLAAAVYFLPLRWSLRKQITLQLEQAFRALHMADYRVSWMTHPYHYLYRGCAKEAALIYECYDEHTFDNYGRRNKKTELLEKQLAQHANFNITTAAALFKKNISHNKHTKLISNGVMYDLFSQSRGPGVQIAPQIERIAHPIIGMIGNLYAGYDFELLTGIMREMPWWSFVFVGSADDNVQGELHRLKQYPNFHLFGWRPYEELPGFLKGFDAAIIPYRINDWTNTINPNKVYDYFAAGVPVVATPIRELQRYRDCIMLCESKDEAVKAMEHLFQYGAEDRINKAREIAKKLSWTAITADIIEEIKLSAQLSNIARRV